MEPEPIRDAAEISPAWLSRVLGGGVRQIAAVRVEPLVGEGVASDVFRVGVDWEEPASGPASVIVKLARREANPAIVGPMYRREAVFYRDLASSVGIRVPLSYFAAFEPETFRYTLVVEDARGIAVPQAEGITLEAADALLRNIGPMHARWWSASGLEGLPEALLFEDRMGLLITRMTETVQRFEARSAGIINGPILELARSLPARAREAVAALRTLPSTLLHGDYDARNVVFAAEEVVVFDWQTLERGPYVVDTSRVIGLSLPAEVRRGATVRLLRNYFQRIQGAGVEYDPGESLLEQYVNGLVVNLARPFMAFSNVREGSPGMAMVASQFTRLAMAIHDADQGIY